MSKDNNRDIRKTLVLVGLNRNESESKLSIVNMAGLR